MGSIARTSTVGAASWSVDGAALAPADGTQLLVSVDPHRAAVTILNDPDSLGDLYIVPAVGQRSGGLRVKPGAGVVVGSVAAVYGYAKVDTVKWYALSESGVVC